MDLALMCDLRIGSASAEFGQPQVKAGAPAAYALLRTVLGESLARWFCLTGERLDAQRCLQLGIIGRKLDNRNELLDAAVALAAQVGTVGARRMKTAFIAERPPLFE